MAEDLNRGDRFHYTYEFDIELCAVSQDSTRAYGLSELKRYGVKTDKVRMVEGASSFFSLDANKVKAFYLAEGEMIEVYSDTLHFCPCEVTKAGFSCIVGLQRGTNLPLDADAKKSNCLWAKTSGLLPTRIIVPSSCAARLPEFTARTGQSTLFKNNTEELK